MAGAQLKARQKTEALAGESFRLKQAAICEDVAHTCHVVTARGGLSHPFLEENRAKACMSWLGGRSSNAVSLQASRSIHVCGFQCVL